MFNKSLIGTETEYGSFDLATGQEEAELLLEKVRGCHAGFLLNGGKMYVDIGKHLEHATPECLDPFEATVYHHAGDLIVWNAARRVRKSVDVYRVNEAIDVKNEEEMATFGCHENYLIDKGYRNEIYDDLLSFLVSRIVLTGSGSLNQGQYYLSQRSHYIEQTLGSETIMNRPIINTREENSLDSERYERLHLIVGDTNVSPWATLLKLGSTALVIWIIELGASFRNVAYAEPVVEMYYLNHATPVLTSGSLPDSAVRLAWQVGLAVQWEYLNTVKQYAKKNLLPDWHAGIVQLWERMLNVVTSNWREAVGILDWPTKLHILEVAHERGFKYGSPAMDSVALEYHHIDPQRSLYTALAGDIEVNFPFSTTELATAASSPSKYHRAKRRAEAVRRGEATAIDWGTITSLFGTEILPL